MIRIHREGLGTLMIAGITLLILNVVLHLLLKGQDLLLEIVVAFSIFFFLFLVSFFRNPRRNTPANDEQVIAPADGNVVVIEETEESEYFHSKRIQISIFMSPANVHVNRVPVGGEVKYVKYHAGKYLVAWHPKSSSENERTTVVVSNQKTEILFRQIAGILARRIVIYVKQGQQVKQGEEFGFIKFGSRVDVFLPPGTKVAVSPGQKVRGGETVIAQLS